MRDAPGGAPDEVPLAGGNATAHVVRVGDSVRKPWTEHSPGVLTYLAVLRRRGVDVPEPRGRDDAGRMVTEYVPGVLATDAPVIDAAGLARVGAMVRAIHDASRGLDASVLGLGPALLPVAGADLVCHGDLTPWNLVIGDRWVFIDWDGTAASTRVWDLAYSAQAFTLNDPAVVADHAAGRLRAFLDGYGADAALRVDLCEALPRRTWAMYDMLETAHRTGHEPWGSMFTAGHGAHWRAVAQYVQRHGAVWASALGV